MKKSLLILLVATIFLKFSSSADEIYPIKAKLKIYYNFNHNLYENYFALDNPYFSEIGHELSSFNIGELSFGISLPQKSKFRHEFEIMPLSFHKSDLQGFLTKNDIKDINISGNKVKNLNSRIAYQINYFFSPEKKFRILLGLSTILYVSHFNKTPYNPANFPVKLNKSGIVLGIGHGFEFSITERMDLIIDATSGILGLNIEKQKVDNPALIHREREQSVFNAEIGNQGFQIRIGLGIEF